MISVAKLKGLLASALLERTSNNQPMMIALSPDPTFFRVGAGLPRKVSDPRSLVELLTHRTDWKPAGRLSRVLAPFFQSSATERDGDGWGGVLLPYLTVFALDWAALLARQMDADPACTVRRRAADAGFRSDYAACLNASTLVPRATRQWANALIGVLRCLPPDAEQSGTPGMIRIEPEAGAARVVWLDGEGKELARETLDRLMGRMSTDAKLADLLRRAGNVEQSQDHHRAIGDAWLEVVCPEIAEAVNDAREHNRQVGYRLFTAKARGHAAEVYLFVGRGLDATRNVSATLVARRAHEDFVLENRSHDLFYFPPIQLVATIEFTPSNPVWHVSLPTVRMPAGQPGWVHPYTGPLHPDHFAKARLIPSDARDVMRDISRETRLLVPGLSLQSNAAPLVGGMCLSGQECQTKAMVGQIQRDESQGKEPNLRNLVVGLWEIVRLGLTRGHQNNLGTPLAELNSSQMIYRIPSIGSLDGTNLQSRVYPYSRGKMAV